MLARLKAPGRRPALAPGGASRPAVLLLFLVATVLRGGGEPIRLELASFEGAEEFWVRTERTEIKEGRGVRAARRSHDTLDLNLVALTRFPDGTYQGVIDVLGRELSVDGGPFEELTLEPRTYSRKLGARLQRAEAWPDDLLGPVLPLLPEKPVAPGERWYSTQPAAGPLPFPVSLEHTFIGTAAIEGVTCQVIETAGTERGRDPTTGYESAVRIDAALALDAVTHVLVKFTFQARAELKSPAPDPAGFQWTLRRFERIVQRRTDEAAIEGQGTGPGEFPGGSFPGGEGPGAAPVPEGSEPGPEGEAGPPEDEAPADEGAEPGSDGALPPGG